MVLRHANGSRKKVDKYEFATSTAPKSRLFATRKSLTYAHYPDSGSRWSKDGRMARTSANPQVVPSVDSMLTDTRTSWCLLLPVRSLPFLGKSFSTKHFYGFQDRCRVLGAHSCSPASPSTTRSATAGGFPLGPLRQRRRAPRTAWTWPDSLSR